MNLSDFKTIDLRYKKGTSDKTYRLIKESDNLYKAEYGRTESRNLRFKEYSFIEASNKLKEKIHEGYIVHSSSKEIKKVKEDVIKTDKRIKTQSTIWDEF